MHRESAVMTLDKASSVSHHIRMEESIQRWIPGEAMTPGHYRLDMLKTLRIASVGPIAHGWVATRFWHLVRSHIQIPFSNRQSLTAPFAFLMMAAIPGMPRLLIAYSDGSIWCPATMVIRFTRPVIIMQGRSGKVSIVAGRGHLIL